MITGDEILETLAAKYERRPLWEFATLENTRPGDILFITGNGVNLHPELLRVLEVGPKILSVSLIFPHVCPVCTPRGRECGHAVVTYPGSALRTAVLTDKGARQA